MNGIVTGYEQVAIIQRIVAECYGIHPGLMQARKRPTYIAHPRQVAMCLAKELTRMTLEDIGRCFGGRDHGTVIHACKAVKARVDTEPSYATETRIVWAKVVHTLYGAHIKSA